MLRFRSRSSSSSSPLFGASPKAPSLALRIIQHRRTVCATAQLLDRPQPLVSGHRGRRSKPDERPSLRQHWAAEGVASGRRVGAPARGVLLPKLPG
eukprot:scaffold16560_cov99-Isochrysis_galbana.AAC.2